MCLQRTQFLVLPNEVICMISRYIEDDHGINALLQTCKRLFLLLNTSLYEHNVNYSYATALEWAAKHGMEATARRALKAGASPNAVYYEAWKPMALACIHSHEAIVRLLLYHGVDPNPTEGWANPEDGDFIIDDYGHPIALAASRGHEGIVKLLLTYGATADTPTTEGDTPLCIAARRGHLSTVKFLANSGCDIDYRHQPWGDYTPLCGAARAGHINVVRYLLEHGANPTPGVRNLTFVPLVEAAEEKHYAVARIIRGAMDMANILSSGDPGDGNHRVLLLVSAACGWDDLVQQLLEQGCPPDAISNERIGYFNYIHEHNPELLPMTPWASNKWERPSALALAAHRGHLGVVQILLRFNTDLHEQLEIGKKPNPLYLAISSSHRHVIQALLDHGANINCRDLNGDPILFRAVRAPEIFQLLLDRGADPDLKAIKGDKILARALRSGNIATVKVLRQGIPFHPPSSPDRRTYEALFEEAAIGGKVMVDYLLSRGYEIEPGSRAVKNALLSALSRSDAPLVSLLFERRLLGTSRTFLNINLFRLVGSVPLRMNDFELGSGDIEKFAATMDVLLLHAVDIEAAASPFFPGPQSRDFHYYYCHRNFYFQQLLDRGADPLRENGLVGLRDTPLLHAAREGWIRAVKMMLNALDERSVPLEELQRKLEQAADKAAENGRMDIVRLLYRAYWRQKNKETPAP